MLFLSFVFDRAPPCEIGHALRQGLMWVLYPSQIVGPVSHLVSGNIDVTYAFRQVSAGRAGAPACGCVVNE